MKFFKESYFNKHYDAEFYKYPLDRVEKQNVLNNLLIQFNDFCDGKDVEYWLDYGTLLGSFRHKGFIPWDNDIDLGMREDDLQKLPTVVETKDWIWKVNPSRAQDRDNTIAARIIDKHTGAFVDVFSYKQLDNGKWQNSFGHDEDEKDENLFPLTTGPFEGKTYKVPNQPKEVLHNYYGADLSAPVTPQIFMFIGDKLPFIIASILVLLATLILVVGQRKK